MPIEPPTSSYRMPYVLWALVDPTEMIAHIIHSTDMSVLDSIDRPVLTHRAWSQEYNQGADIWYGFMRQSKRGPRLLAHKNLADWFDEMIDRNVAPECKLIEYSHTQVTPNELKNKKRAAIRALVMAGFDVLTSHTGVSSRKGRRMSIWKPEPYIHAHLRPLVDEEEIVLRDVSVS